MSAPVDIGTSAGGALYHNGGTQITQPSSLWEYARLEGFREGFRVARLHVLKPFVFPVYKFVKANYHTEDNLRLAKVSGTALWWRLFGSTAKPDEFRDDDPRTADEVISRLFDYADTQKPLADVGERP